MAENHPILVQVLGTHQQCFVEFCVELMLSLGFVTILHHLKTSLVESTVPFSVLNNYSTEAGKKSDKKGKVASKRNQKFHLNNTLLESIKFEMKVELA